MLCKAVWQSSPVLTVQTSISRGILHSLRCLSLTSNTQVWPAQSPSLSHPALALPPSQDFWVFALLIHCEKTASPLTLHTQYKPDKHKSQEGGASYFLYFLQCTFWNMFNDTKWMNARLKQLTQCTTHYALSFSGILKSVSTEQLETKTKSTNNSIWEKTYLTDALLSFEAGRSLLL